MKKIILIFSVLMISVSISFSQAGSWRQIGKAGSWIGTISAIGNGSNIYTVESSGALHNTLASSGTWTQLGKADYVNTKFMVTANSKLYTIEKSGTLYEVNVN